MTHTNVNSVSNSTSLSYLGSLTLHNIPVSVLVKEEISSIDTEEKTYLIAFEILGSPKEKITGATVGPYKGREHEVTIQRCEKFLAKMVRTIYIEPNEPPKPLPAKTSSVSHRRKPISDPIPVKS